jgi:hypothetical protein
MARKKTVKAKASKAKEPSRSHWEYETASVSRITEASAINGMLNALGVQGWELVAAIPEDDATYLILKRLKT